MNQPSSSSSMIDLVNATQDHLERAGLDTKRHDEQQYINPSQWGHEQQQQQHRASSSSSAAAAASAATASNKIKKTSPSHVSIHYEDDETAHHHEEEDESSQEVWMQSQVKQSERQEEEVQGQSDYGDSVKLKECVDIVLSFLEVVVHNLLYHRRVYPPNVFERVREYDVVVYKSRFEKLTHYIKEILEDARPMLHNGTMDKMCVVILDKDYCALEQYMFTLAIDTNNQIPATYGHLRQQLVRMLSKLSTMEVPEKLRKNISTFTLLVHSTEEYPSVLQASQKKEQTWAPLDTLDQEARLLRKNKHSDRETVEGVVPLSSVSAGPLRIGCVHDSSV